MGVAGAAAAAAAGGLLAACGSSGGSTNTTKASSTSSNDKNGKASGTPKPGGTLVVATEAEDNGFNPFIASWDVTGSMYGHALYDTLTAVDANGDIQPYLATSITANADNTQFTFGVRPNIKFHDGTACDAAAIVASIKAAVASPQNGPSLLNVADVSASADGTQVIVKCKEPWTAFPYYLSGTDGTILAPAMLSAKDGGNRNPIGTGAFTFVEWVPNDHLTVKKNPNYWRQGLPYLDQVTFKPIPDHLARENSLKAGDIDIMHTDDEQFAHDFSTNPGKFQYINDLGNTATEHEMHFLMINCAQAPLDDVRVRQALAYATDRNKVIQIANAGITPDSTGPYTKGSKYYAPTGYPSYDPTKAKALIAEYEKDKGPLPTIALTTVTDAKDLQRIQLIAGIWEQNAGIKTQISQVEQSQYIVQALLGNYQVRDWRQFSAADPDENYVWWSTLTASPIGKLALNFARNKDDQIQADLEKGRTAGDSATRVAAYQDIAKRFGQDVPYLWINQTVWSVAAAPNVMNFNGATLPDGKPELGMTAGFINVREIWKA